MFKEVFAGAAALKIMHMLRGNRINVPAGTLGISRQQMPQIDSHRLDELRNWLNSQGVSVNNGVWYLDRLRLVQAEYNRDKVLKIMDNPKNDSPPILVSKDGYVLDGSHRFIARYNRKGTAKTIRTITIGLNARQAIDMLRKFPGVQFRTHSDKSVAK